ncbi:hypothetical protein HK096_003526, partial [Nowakowskiella sp. JEL0078]
KITSLLHIASSAVSLLAVEDSLLDTVEDTFEQNIRDFLTTLNEIQIALRMIFDELSSKGILRPRLLYGVNSIPYSASINGHEKDLDLIYRHVSLIQEEIIIAQKEFDTAYEEVEEEEDEELKRLLLDYRDKKISCYLASDEMEL